MVSLIWGNRPAQRPGADWHRTGPSVREACLPDMERLKMGRACGERLTWAGRLYKVLAAQSRPIAQQTRLRYLHLKAGERSGSQLQEI